MSLPNSRFLKGYAFDPSLSQRIDTYQINQVLYEIPWEDIDYSNGTLKGEYVEIIDYDPTISKFYKTVDLDSKAILANNGLNPSESNPMFHQQMVYAVVMTTIKNFERALGRKVLWSTRKLDYDRRAGKDLYEEYVDKLRIYPHALREPNAYYSPQKKALLFGYFNSNPIDQMDQMPGTLVFTCLSHDIIAHETTHAILDGLHRYYNEPTNPDVLAFHEAFADIVALFQHFSFPEVLKHQIANTRGNLSQQNLLGELAQQFGVAVGHYDSLRSAIGQRDSNKGIWEPKRPDPKEYHRVMEPHYRGSILVAAVFEVFISIYNRRTSDLNRLASNGTGILPHGELHPDLVNRLANEASKASQHILYMCIRALDYCPPVDITFGDFLRAIITADSDLVSNDPYSYRLAFIEAFKKRGIYPSNIKTLSLESLHYPKIVIKEMHNEPIGVLADFLRYYANRIGYHFEREKIYEITKAIISGSADDNLKKEMGMGESEKILGLHNRVNIKFDTSDFVKLTGLYFGLDPNPYGITYSHSYSDLASFSIQNLRIISRVGPDGNKLNQVIFSIIQKAGVVIKDGKVIKKIPPYKNRELKLLDGESYYIFNGGCTLMMNLDTQKLVYSIIKPLLVFGDEESLPELNIRHIEKQWKYQFETSQMSVGEFQQYFNDFSNGIPFEPFAMLHQNH